MGIFTRVVTASNVNAGVEGADKYDHGFSDNTILGQLGNGSAYGSGCTTWGVTFAGGLGGLSAAPDTIGGLGARDI